MKVAWVFASFVCLILRDCAAKRIEDSNTQLNFVNGSWVFTSCPMTPGEEEVYEITLPGLKPFNILCNAQIAGAGYAVIASRTNANLNFFRNWQDYKNGFGDLSDDFFLGLDKVHAITKSQPHELYIQLEDFDGNIRFARYDEFYIENENVSYKLSKLGAYTGDAGDSLSPQLNFKFTTYDNDNGPSSDNCAVKSLGAWWYDSCHQSNLFGMYLAGDLNDDTTHKGMSWYNWHSSRYSLKSMKIMVRPKNSCSVPEREL